MFGKDTAHCDTSGFVTDLLDQHITRVALGKAHCVALNNKGHLFTFGLNNKGQCGRPIGKDSSAAQGHSATSTVSSTTTASKQDNLENVKQAASNFKYNAASSILCDLEDHNVVQGQCRVCSMCRECTGYNISCVSTQNIALENRIPGA